MDLTTALRLTDDLYDVIFIEMTVYGPHGMSLLSRDVLAEAVTHLLSDFCPSSLSRENMSHASARALFNCL